MATEWFSELDMDESSFFQQWEAAAADSLNHFTEQQLSILAFGQMDQQQLPQIICTDKPKKVSPKACSWDSSITTTTTTTTTDQSSSPTFLSFSNSDVDQQPSHLHDHQNLKKEDVDQISFPHPQVVKRRKFDALVGDQEVRKMTSSTSSTCTTTRPASQNQEHIIAERRRREKLSQRFIALSSIIPGLKKMDKASVLGDAIKYLKQLQEKVKSLEEQAAARKRRIESAVLVKKSQLISPDDDTSSCVDDELSDVGGHFCGAEIEVKMSENTVLIKIHCDNQKGLLVRALSEIECHRLTIVSTSVIPFAASSIDITVMAQVEEGFSMTVKDLVKNLSSSFKQFM